MSSYKPMEYAAIAHYADTHNCVPQLSLYPSITFKSRDTGELFERNIHILVTEHEDHKTELRREKARQRALEKKKAEAKR